MEWLTKEQIDQVIDVISAGDLIDATDEIGATRSTKMVGAIFDRAANRALGQLTEGRWVDRVKGSDLKYLGEAVGGAINVDSPLSDATSGLLDSPEPGVEDSDLERSETFQPLTT